MLSVPCISRRTGLTADSERRRGHSSTYRHVLTCIFDLTLLLGARRLLCAETACHRRYRT